MKVHQQPATVEEMGEREAALTAATRTRVSSATMTAGPWLVANQ
jgi:hypothetical protein